ncbi:16581_t:CDS:2 [Acaulospora colombiana]|uniref:16581_t:CDS:1 n=1 Tax=Acaulospora colombiana TaxID=27376 RepID=A0ACA9KIK7_9GLOM|nr:16581_t:CDS:2 [Acaulospora colombiana]
MLDLAECRDQQENEILALEAIYSNDFTYTETPNSTSRYRGALSTEISLSQEISIFFAGGINAGDPLKVRHLPPVKIVFSMPAGYPTDEPLEFAIECCWMRWDWIKMLERKLHQIWEEEKDVVLYNYSEFIKNSSLDYLQVEFPLKLDGFLLQVKCPEPSCKSQHKTVEEIAEIVGAEMAKRYSDLLEKQRLEVDPLLRKIPISKNYACARNAHSLSVGFVNGPATIATRHGASVPCPVNFTKRLIQEYLEADETKKATMELRYGAKNLEKLVHDANINAELETDKWMKSNTQPYPDEPYRHFNDKKSPCNQRLFDGTNVDELDMPEDFVFV